MKSEEVVVLLIDDLEIQWHVGVAVLGDPNSEEFIYIIRECRENVGAIFNRPLLTKTFLRDLLKEIR